MKTQVLDVVVVWDWIMIGSVQIVEMHYDARCKDSEDTFSQSASNYELWGPT